MKGEEQQADRGENGWKSRLCGREGGSNRGAHAAAKEQFLWVAKHFRRESRASNFGSVNLGQVAGSKVLS